MLKVERVYFFSLYCCTFGRTSQVTYKAGSGYINGVRGDIKIRRTMENLLVYLLEHAHGVVVSDDELLLKVWEDNRLSSSTQRLGRVIKDLKNVLLKAGLDEQIIFRVQGQGYILDSGLVLPMFSKNINPTDQTELYCVTPSPT